MAEKFILLCKCGWKRISELVGDKDLFELKNDTLSARKFRCPSCGFAVSPKKFPDPQSELDRAKRDAKATEENKRWLEDSFEKQSEFIKEIQNAEESDDQ